MDEGQILIHEVGYLAQNHFWMFPNTVSPFWRLYYNFDPGHKVVFADHEIPLTPEQIVLIPDHQIFDSYGKQPVRHLWMTFSLDLMLRQGDSISLPVSEIERDRIDRISALVASTDPNKRFRILHESSALLHALLARPDIPLRDYPRSPAALKIAAHISENVAEVLEIPALARLAGISPRKLSALFQREYQMTLSQFISRVRTREAARLLETTELSLESIAEQTGLSNRYYLTRVFTRVIGKSPAGFRKATRIDQSIR